MGRLSERTIGRLRDLINGDNGEAGYLAGPKLVRLFNEAGYEETYGAGFPSRAQYTEDHLGRLADTVRVGEVLEYYFDPLTFVAGTLNLPDAVAVANRYLERDGLRLDSNGGRYRLAEIQTDTVPSLLDPTGDLLSAPGMAEHLRKCEERLESGDYSGAITSARSLVESLLQAISVELIGEQTDTKGNLQQLFLEVRKMLEARALGISDPERQTLTGLIDASIGVGRVRNTRGDAHGTPEPSERRQALLAINAARTIGWYLVDVIREQRERPA